MSEEKPFEFPTRYDEPSQALTPEEEAKIRIAKQLAQVVCICKGIRLGSVLKGMEGCETVEEVNQKAGTGSGGCAGQRCGPRIKILLQKQAQKKKP